MPCTRWGLQQSASVQRLWKAVTGMQMAFGETENGTIEGLKRKVIQKSKTYHVRSSGLFSSCFQHSTVQCLLASSAFASVPQWY